MSFISLLVTAIHVSRKELWLRFVCNLRFSPVSRAYGHRLLRRHFYVSKFLRIIQLARIAAQNT
jgi:hypothetical protein